LGAEECMKKKCREGEEEWEMGGEEKGMER